VDHEPTPEILPLPEPRPLTTGERELLDFLVNGPVDSPELRAQAAGAMVVGVCSCGCPSIQLGVEENAPRAALDGPEVRNPGWAEIRAVGSVEDGLATGVNLHIAGDLAAGEGVLELEVWPTSRFGEQRQLLPPISSLHFTS
jgi:hypothetical protein